MHDAVLEEHLDGDGHLAMALCRPGGPGVRGDDELWIEALRSTLDDGQIDGSWSLHLGAGGEVTALVEAPSWVWRR
jgi:hypothetical protein